MPALSETSSRTLRPLLHSGSARLGSVILAIVQTDPGAKGDTRTGAMKPAKMETGAVVQVPLFVEEGVRVKVDTRSGEYIERVKS